MKPEPRLTVAICTWNRCELLRQTLEQMTSLQPPPGAGWELLVVNNNCTDATDEVIAAYADRLPIRRIFEPEPGQSNARNAAVREAAGEYIVWTDDDVLVDPQWLVAYQAGFDRWAEASIFGGPIAPWFDGTPPDWLVAVLPQVEGAYAIRDLGPDPVALGHDTYPFGANMAFRTDVLRRNAYDPALGLRPGSSVRGEEMTLTRRLLALGERGWWVPGARVRHFIPRERQNLRYLRDYYFGGGKLLAALEDGHAPYAPRFLGRPLWLWKQAVLAELQFRVRHLTSTPERWIEPATVASLSWGQLFGGRSNGAG
jgi:glucosyl-dolichyl phosphate glucuronosyltransferase